MQGQLDPYLKHLTKTVQLCEDYRERVLQLFKGKEGVSQKHMERGIVINARILFNLFESNFLISTKQHNLALYYQLKSQVFLLVRSLIDGFPLNAKFIYEEAQLIIENNRRINFVTYLIRDAKESFQWQLKDRSAKEIATLYHAVSTEVFYQICNICTLRTSELKEITNSLTDFYYEQQLSTKLIGHCFRMLDAGLQERNITPYLYFVGNHKSDSVRILLSNNRWHFGKGMTLILWINTLKKTDCRLFWMTTDDGNQLTLRLEGDQLIVESQYQEKKDRQVVAIFNLPVNSPVMLGIELEPVGLLSTSFRMNLRVNGVEYPDICKKMPSFQKSEFIVEFSLLNNFIGKLYSIIITTQPELNRWQDIRRINQYGICRESLVWEFINQNIIKAKTILCVFNSQRNFQGLLLNYVDETNHACFEGKVSQVKYHKYDSKVIDIYLPFLHMLSTNITNEGLIEEKDVEWGYLFDLIIQHILQIIISENYEIDSILLLLYFLQVNSYQISQSTLNCLYQHTKQHQNFFLKLVIKYMDVHTLIQNGLKIDELLEPFDDPVEKTIFMFYLETLWKEKWNTFQGFQGWWSPHFFNSQNDLPFDPKDFVYSPNRQDRVEWSVLNLVTKDCCKCFVEPVFKVPAYAQSNRYQQEYIKKECYNQKFKLNLSKKDTYTKLICPKSTSSNFDKLKSKLFNLNDFSQYYKERFQFKQFSTPCLFIDILTVIEGHIRITKQGFIIFSSSHKGKTFDHMCIKAFKNQTLYYFMIALVDIRKIYKKRFNASNNAIYIKTKDGREMLFHFYLRNVDAFLSNLDNQVKIKTDSFTNYMNSSQPLHWIDKGMSNYEYLQWLNQITGRNYNDITQYPVLPWTFVANDESDQRQFRDLTKNMGSHGDAERVGHFLEKYTQNNDEELFNEYHYGTHYSSSAIIFNYLIRIRPYSIGALTLQSGRFDCADRIFYSYCGSWNNAICSPTDVRELIPQVYTLPEMFINKNNYEYGLTQEKISVDNVFLPDWSKQNPFMFVSRLRKELQSRTVSETLNQWIDLIYGYKQRGKEAVECMNIFYPLTYQHCIDLEKVKDPDERMSFQTQIAHFGQNPSQIIGNNPHPTRRVQKAHWQDKLIADGGQLMIQKCFLNKAPLKQEKFLFKSVFEGRNSILSIKFISNDLFFVLRKHQYYLFKIINKKTDFLSKEQTTQYDLQSCEASLNYKQLTVFVPVISIGDQVVIVGGFYNGNVQVIFLNQPKFNRIFKFPINTITAINYQKTFHTLFLGDVEGDLKAYRVNLTSKQIEFEAIRATKAHDSRINNITVNNKANLLCTCSLDGSLNLYNLYSLSIIRTIHHPHRLPIYFAQISTSPLYSVVFYSKQNNTIYIYSINGQFLDSIIEKTGFVYNLSVLRSTDSTECLVYLNAQREMYVWELPFAKLRRRVKVKKDQFRISCFETCINGKIGINGTEDGAFQLITNPTSI